MTRARLHATRESLALGKATVPRIDVVSAFTRGDDVVLLDAKGRAVEAFTLPGRAPNWTNSAAPPEALEDALRGVLPSVRA